jgi:hypothetical protein
MPIGNRFKLKTSTLAAGELHRNGKFSLVTIPAGAIITVADAGEDKMVTVLWEGRTLAMFVADLKQRTTEFLQDRGLSEHEPLAELREHASAPENMSAEPNFAVAESTCRMCGLRGLHADQGECIDALRSMLADLQFRLRHSAPAKPIERSRKYGPRLPTLSSSGCGE